MKLICKFLIILLSFFPLVVLGEEKEDPIPNAKSGILIDAATGKILYQKKANDKLAIASMTKMVAQIIILEKIEEGKIKWDDIVTGSKNAASMGGSQIYLAEGEKISIRDLMKGISMASGNDATVQMAEVISGSEKKFVELMNDKVKELGLKNTHFVNCTGLDEKNHYSSAYDLAMIARDLLINHPTILKFSSVYEDYLRENTKNKFWLVNTNKLVRFYEGCDGLKTGHTDNAGYCLSATAKRNNYRLIGIVLGESNSKVRNKETMNLLDYGFMNTKYNVLKKAKSIVKRVALDKAKDKEIDIHLKNNLGVVEDVNDDEHNYKFSIKLNNIKLPVKANSIVGKMNVREDNKIVASSPLIVLKDVDKLNYFELFLNNLNGIVSGNI